ncbi:hypothetical protein ABZ442_25105 [Streptomyces triculaminicus]
MRKLFGTLAVLGAVGGVWLYGPGDVVHATVCVGLVNCQHVH